MRRIGRDRWIYAGITFLVLFGSYVWTLSPTLTFWDAGEFISASYILGVPHPPGTPLFVLIGHVFGMIPLGIGFAAKLNLMSALSSSIAGLLLFLTTDQVISRINRDRGWELSETLVHVATMAAVLMGGWGLTMWYNSTETEVYTVAIMTIALTVFLAMWWADHMEEGKDWNLLLLIVFLMGLSIGNHLMALLVMPGVVVYGVVVTWGRHRDYVLSLLVGAVGLYLVVMRGISVDGLLAGDSVVNGGWMVIGLLVLGAGLWWMRREGALTFFGSAILCFLAGASVILFLKLRAMHDPAINEANPETWAELLAVLARKQYDVRPLFPRATSFFQYQIPLYFDYLFGQVGPFESRVSSQFGLPGLSILAFLLAIVGSVYHYLADRTSWVLYLFVYLMTSLGLVFYLNFPLGNTQAPEAVLQSAVNLDIAPYGREVREREYFFIVSYVFLGLWAGVGAFALLGETIARWGRRVRVRGAALAGAAAVLLLLPAAVFALNYHEANRRGNYIARDFAYNLLQSVEPWGILFTNGDNDTFPLWYLQEVEGIRQDVTIVNLALLNTTWYIQQLADKTFTASNPPGSISAEVTDVALLAHGVEPGEPPSRTILNYTGASDDPLARIGFVIDEETSIDVGGVQVTLEANSILRRQDVGILQVIRRHQGERPIYFSVTVPDDAKLGLDDYLVREGVVDRLLESPAPELARQGRPYLPMQPPERAWIHVPRTETLLEEVYLYRGIDDESIYKDGTGRALIGNYGATYLQLAAAQARRGETEAAVEALQRGHEILGREPGDDPYLTSLINVFAVSGSYERLDSLLQAAQERRGGRLEDRYYKTAAYNSAVVGHYEMADRILQKYFVQDPVEVEPDLWIELAEMAMSTGDSSQAITFLSRAIRVDPNNQRAFLRHINLAHDMGNEVMAKTFIYQWVRTHPNDTVTARLYEQYLETDRFPEELEWENVARPGEGGGARRRGETPFDTVPTIPLPGAPGPGAGAVDTAPGGR